MACVAVTLIFACEEGGLIKRTVVAAWAVVMVIHTAVFSPLYLIPFPPLSVATRVLQVCLDILKSAWSPVWNLSSLCRAICALLAHPEPSSPLNCDAGGEEGGGQLGSDRRRSPCFAFARLVV